MMTAFGLAAEREQVVMFSTRTLSRVAFERLFFPVRGSLEHEGTSPRVAQRLSISNYEYSTPYQP